MVLTKLSPFLVPVLLCMTEAVFRFTYLCDITPGIEGKRYPYNYKQILCAMEGLRSMKENSISSMKLLDTRSCTFIEMLVEGMKHEKRYFWEICECHQLQLNTIERGDPAMLMSNSPASERPTDSDQQIKALFIFTFNVDSQRFQIITKNRGFSSNQIVALGEVTDAVVCPGSEKPLKFVSKDSKIHSFTFPILQKHDIYAFKDHLKININFLRCDTTSGVILPISDRIIFNGSWEGEEPQLTCLTNTPGQILTVAMETVTRMLYWREKCSSYGNCHHVDLYRIQYSGEQRKKKKIGKLEKVTSFVVDPFQHCIYACGGVLKRFTMGGEQVHIDGDPAKFINHCAAVALFRQDLYVHSRNGEGAIYHINSTKATEEYGITYKCNNPCISQVFEAVIPKKYLAPPG